MNRLEVASKYVEMGFKVYPLAEETKIPLKGSHGYKDASNSPDVVSKWFSNHDYNIGLSLVNTGILVVDLDRGHSSGLNGIETYRGLYHEQHFKPLPTDSYVERTPSGGLHWFLSYPESVPVKTLQSAFCKDSGIDILAGNTGVPVFGTSINGIPYIPKTKQTLLDVKPAPAWVLDQFKPVKHRRIPVKPLTNWTGQLLDELVEGTGVGNRNSYLAKMTGKLFRTGARSQTVLELLEFANDHLDTPLPDRELNTIFNSILKSELKRE